MTSSYQPSCIATCIKSYPSSCPYINTSTGYANIPLCFRNGWPSGCAVPACGCYQPGWQGSWTNPSVPCLPPIINGRLVPPCTGQFAVIQQCYQQGYVY